MASQAFWECASYHGTGEGPCTFWPVLARTCTLADTGKES